MSSLADRVYDLLKARIVVLDIPPGSVLHERELMCELKVSQTPIREALQRLERDGLVVIQLSRTMYVSEITLTDLRAVCEARLGSEGGCARLAAQRISESDLAQLERHISLVEGAAGDEFVERLVEGDRQLHHTIAKAAGNHLLLNMVQRLHTLSVRMWRLIPHPEAGADETMRYHRSTVDALRRRDPDAAERAIRSDVHHFWNLVRSQI